MQRIILAVTNDLTYDQRMHRICTTLTNNGYEVTLAGRKLKNSLPVKTRAYRQRRLYCVINKTIIYYAFYNIRLFSWLLTEKADIVCAVDLDTILACYFASKIKKWKCVYDAHELFTEQHEIMVRPFVYKLWLSLEKFAVPRFPHGYTVNGLIAKELNRRYGVNYSVVRNMALKKDYLYENVSTENTILFHGLVKEGRSFEGLIPAMKYLNAKLIVCGDGDFMYEVKKLISDYKIEEKVELKGMVLPEELHQLMPSATIAVMLLEKSSLNQYHSLTSRFFDYIIAGVPQVCMAYPEYKAINDKYNIALLIEDTKPATIAEALTRLLTDKSLYNTLKQNCIAARKIVNWENEEKKLLAFYKNL